METKISQQEIVRRLRDWLQQLIPHDWDRVDLAAIVDSTLTYSENKELVREEVKYLVKDVESDAKTALAEKEKYDHERKRAAENEVVALNKNVSYDECKELDKFYRPIHRAVLKIVQGYSHLAFIKGRCGIGKSENIRKVLVENRVEFEEVCGEVSEAYLYRLIYENNGKIVWFKDIVKLLGSIGALNLMKGACESHTRILTKSNYSKVQDDLPDKFVCKCKFIFDYNNIVGVDSKMRDDFEALVSRGDFVELPICDTEIQEIMRIIAKTDEEKLVTEFLIENFKSTGLIRLNLRTQWKSFQTYKFAEQNNFNWEEEVKRELDNYSRTRGVLYSLIGKKAVRTTELKKLLLKNEIVGTIRSADNYVNKLLFMDELFRWSEEERNFFIGVNPKPTKQRDITK